MLVRELPIVGMDQKVRIVDSMNNVLYDGENKDLPDTMFDRFVNYMMAKGDVIIIKVY